MTEYKVTDDCILCKAELKALEDSDLENFNMTESCSKCEGEFVASVDNPNLSDLQKEYYLPVMRDCALNGNVDA